MGEARCKGTGVQNQSAGGRGFWVAGCKNTGWATGVADPSLADAAVGCCGGALL